jgi:hypothetical protein
MSLRNVGKYPRDCTASRLISSFNMKVLFSACHLLSCSAYSTTLKMEAACSTETLLDFQQTTRRYIPEDRTIHNHCSENLKSYITGHVCPRYLRIYHEERGKRTLRNVGEYLPDHTTSCEVFAFLTSPIIFSPISLF